MASLQQETTKQRGPDEKEILSPSKVKETPGTTRNNIRNAKRAPMSASDVFSKPKFVPKPLSRTPKSAIRSSPQSQAPPPPMSEMSNIPVAAAKQTGTISRPNRGLNDRHTLEIQFINKNKSYLRMKQDLEGKQKPVLDLYKNLTQIKMRLEDLGKTVRLEDVKMVSVSEYGNTSSEGTPGNLSKEVVEEMVISIEKIPKIFSDVCKNLLTKRSLMIELLDSVSKSEINNSDVSDRIDSLKIESTQIQISLDNIITDIQTKITDLTAKWSVASSNHQSDDEAKELDIKYKEQQKLMLEWNLVISNYQKKSEAGKVALEKSNKTIHALEDKIKMLEHDLEIERKTSTDVKGRNHTNIHSIKSMKAKMIELEEAKKHSEITCIESQKNQKQLQEELRFKEAKWMKEKEDMIKTFNQQNSILNKYASEKTNYATTLEAVETQKLTTEDELNNQIDKLNNYIINLENKSEELTKERNEAKEKCAQFEANISRMGLDFKETMNKVFVSMKNGKDVVSENAEQLREHMAKDLEIRELKDKLNKLERDRLFFIEEQKLYQEKQKFQTSDIDKELSKQKECIISYKRLLEDSEDKLKEKSNEVEYLKTEIRQLKVRQEALEEQNSRCPTDELQRIVEEGRHKLNQLIKKSLDSEQKMEQYIDTIEKQAKQMSEMENLIRYKENLINIIKAARVNIFKEKESITRYSQELRSALAEVTGEIKMKDALLMKQQDQLELREKQIDKLEKVVKEHEDEVVAANEKRFKIQHKLQATEGELQKCKTQLADFNLKSGRPKVKPF
ncbi:unnamed protein product [Ceutorhynchus assimilis]|uniref:Uncharacterized protein n=1 Tax=Ceutorhynchus assimilis TaxID=467358 RepID=A0A9N9MQ39_9CUCU|nr:unnamed protein product [Ceutorhynchus assimilis]